MTSIDPIQTLLSLLNDASASEDLDSTRRFVAVARVYLQNLQNAEQTFFVGGQALPSVGDLYQYVGLHGLTAAAHDRDLYEITEVKVQIRLDQPKYKTSRYCELPQLRNKHIWQPVEQNGKTFFVTTEPKAQEPERPFPRMHHHIKP